MRYVWDRIKGEVVPAHERTPEPGRGPNVISDTMPMLKHMGTGVMTDSKSHFRRMTRSIGAVEAGNDPALLRDPPKEPPPQEHYVPYVKQAIEMCRR